MDNITIGIENNFQLRNKALFVAWLERCIHQLQKQIGEIHIALMSDERLLELNQKHLNHDDYTDVITFDHSVGNTLHCDIAISTDRVSENADNQGVSQTNELARVMIHGILHCVGFQDKTLAEQALMREKENAFLQLFHVEPNSRTQDV